MEQINIRLAEKRDLPAIFKLVKELALFENEPDSVTATVTDYENHFEAIFKAFVAEANGNIVGTALFYPSFSTWRGKMFYLEDFIVSKSHRSKGIGQMLFDSFVEYAKSQNAVMVKWEVLDWNEGAIRFYEKNKATIEKCWWDGKIIF